MSAPASIRQQLVSWGLILGLWGLLVLAFAGQLVFTGSMDWVQAIGISVRDWFPWVLLAPIVAWLAFRFPLEQGKLGVSIPIHFVACILATCLCELLSRPLGPATPPPGGGPQYRLRRGIPPERLPLNPEDRPPGGIGMEHSPVPPSEARRALFLNSRARFNLPIYWVIVSIVHALTYYRRSQERERAALELEARLAEARLQALRMQLHPHFLFNTLHAISTLVHKDPDAADEMIGNLSELLRAALDTSDQQEVPLHQELDFLERYLEIQQARFGDRLRVQKQIDATALEARVPTFILQPLVENAIRHGVEPHPGPGEVVIRVQRNGESLHLNVRDSGRGTKKSSGQSEGIGLANTKARLQQLYGAKARLTLTTASESGCAVEMEIPFREASAAAAPPASVPRPAAHEVGSDA